MADTVLVAPLGSAWFERCKPPRAARPHAASGPRRPAITAPSSSPTPIWARAAARPKLLADFLAHNDCETLYLVGDIVDGWQLKRRWYWTEAQSRVVARNPAQGR